MQIIKLTGLISISLLASIGLSKSPLAYGQDSAQKEQALAAIENAADKFCQSVPIAQTSSGSELTAQGKAQLSGLFGKIADIGGSGSAEHSASHSRGVLQTDLAAAINDRNNCQLKVLEILKPEFLGPSMNAGNENATSSPSVQSSFSNSNTSLQQQPIYIEHWTANPTNETEIIARDLRDSLRSAGFMTTPDKPQGNYIDVDVEMGGPPVQIQRSALEAPDYEVDLTVTATEEPGNKPLIDTRAQNQNADSDQRSAEGDALDQAVKQITQRLGKSN